MHEINKITNNDNLLNFTPSTINTAHNKTDNLANADTGTTGNFISIKDMQAIENITTVEKGNGINVELPDGRAITSIATGQLKWKWLTKDARTVHIFKELTGSLLSIGMLCDAGCSVNFKQKTVVVEKDGKVMLKGKRQNKLWMISLNNDSETTPQHTSAQMIANTTHAEIVKYAHLSMGAPAIPTFITAIKRGYITPPGVTTEMVRKNMPTSTATAKGHLNLSKQGLRSTKEVEEEEEFNFPSKIHGEHKIVTVTMQILNTEELLHVHADLAGRFPYKSRRGKQYFAVFFNIETNYIRIELLERRTSEDITNAYRAALDFFEQHGIKVQFVHLDGETSNELEKYIDKKKINIQFAPPGNHRALKAERAIQTVKNHVISSLCTADPSYPMLDWDLFKDQMELTLNLLRGSAVNPSICVATCTRPL